MVRTFRKTGGTWANQKITELKTIALNGILVLKYGVKVRNITM